MHLKAHPVAGKDTGGAARAASRLPPAAQGYARLRPPTFAPPACGQLRPSTPAKRPLAAARQIGTCGFLEPNIDVAAFFEIYKICILCIFGIQLGNHEKSSSSKRHRSKITMLTECRRKRIEIDDMSSDMCQNSKTYADTWGIGISPR